MEPHAPPLTVTARDDGKTSYQVDSSKGAGLGAIPLRPRILAFPPHNGR